MLRAEIDNYKLILPNSLILLLKLRCELHRDPEVRTTSLAELFLSDSTQLNSSFLSGREALLKNFRNNTGTLDFS